MQYKVKLTDQDNKVVNKIITTDDMTGTALGLVKSRLYKQVIYTKL